MGPRAGYLTEKAPLEQFKKDAAHPLAASPSIPIDAASHLDGGGFGRFFRQLQGAAGNAAAQDVASSLNPAHEESEATDETATDARKGRTTVSKTLTTVKEAAKAASAATNGRAAGKLWTAADPASDYFEARANDPAFKAAEKAEARAAKVDGKIGSNSPIGKTLRIANHVLMFSQNLSRGQGVGESAAGAIPGAAVNNAMTRKVFARSPGLGWADTAINLFAAGANLLGAPEEVTGFAQTAADATPTTMATNLASNAGRGLWNLGDGIFNGDWSAMKQQGDDLARGKEGGPLQGLIGLPILMGSTSREDYGEITDDMRKGEYGFLPKTSLATKDAVFEGSPMFGAARERWLRMKETEPERQEAAEMREAKQRGIDKRRTEAFDKEFKELGELIKRGPANPAMMTGTAGDPMSAQATLARVQASLTDDEEELEGIKKVSMALPERRKYK